MRPPSLRCSLRMLLTIVLAACCFLGGRASRNREVAAWRGQAIAHKKKLETFQARQQQLQTQRATFLQHVALACGMSDSGPNDRQVETVVTLTSGNLAEINAGADDGLHEEMVLEVGRGTAHVGRGLVRKVTADRAVIENTGRRLWTVRKGDRAILINRSQE